MKSYSQAGQDLWVIDTLGGVRNGRFLDCGANDPVVISNTYGLETQFGWTGVLLDNDPNCIRDLRAKRSAKVIECDTTKFDYKSIPYDYDYLSLDVDSASADSLEKLLNDGITFRCATIETDEYRFGEGPRNRMMEMLLSRGYKLVRDKVCNPESPYLPYEFWWIDTKRV
jgi:hypothetical protein